ncbi:RluA family pseudouridine synthase [Candidatus Woesebacteria bacterium]|nr:RluA family pseudouridine synthase [Candidatus Woesebacteria bacterium]
MLPKTLEPTILLENEHVLVLNKPAGVVVNRASSVKVSTLQDWVEAYLQADPVWQRDRAVDQIFAERSGMVHRIDKDTSGAILFAKQAVAMHDLMRQFKERTVQKTYVALVHGHLPTHEGIVRAPIVRHPKSRERFTVGEGGRPSETYYKVKKEFSSINIEKLLQENKKSEHPIRALEKEIKVYEGGFTLVEFSAQNRTYASNSGPYAILAPSAGW